MKRITKEPWFGKKTLGLGIKPITWQGWIITLILLLLSILSIVHYKKSLMGISIIILLLVIYIIAALLTGIKTDYTLKEKG